MTAKEREEQMNRRLDRKDMLILALLGAVYTLFLVIYVGVGNAFGSTLDWAAQHYAIPDYFRKLFYETGEFFPSFAPNIGAGENIYVFSYYGLYSPVILFSYLLPFVSMATYIQVSSAVLCFLGGALLYRFARKRNSKAVSAALAVAYLCASPIILHSHRHIMFVNYMPFVILAYEAVDNYFEGRRRWSLTFWAFMIILTSWFFSVAALISVTVYGVYRYLSVTDKFSVSDFAKAGAGFALRLICAVMMAGVLLLPTVHVLMQGRDSSNVSIPFTQMLPSVRLNYFGYSSYALGMGCFALLSVVGAVMRKDKAQRFLGIALAIIICVPPVNYLLNGTMYLNGKVLIPFIPAVLVLCAEQLRGVSRKELYVFIGVFAFGQVFSRPSLFSRSLLLADFAVLIVLYILSVKKERKDSRYWLVSLTLVPLISMVLVNIDDLPLPTLSYMESYNNASHEKLSEIIGQDSELWRSSMAEIREDTPNSVPTTDFYNPYIYSSVHHKGYNDFYFNVMNNENEYRNSALTTRSQNPFFEIYISNGYLISEKAEAPFGYDEAARDGDLYLYKNRYALPLGRLQQPLGEDVFDKMNSAEKMSALCRYVIVGEGGELQSPVTDKGELTFPNVNCIEPVGDKYRVVSDEPVKFSMKLPFEVGSGRALVLELVCDNTTGIRGDARLTINGIRNTLTDPDWKYYNNNTVFTYVLAPRNGESLDTLDMMFTAGDYTVTRLHAYELDLPVDAAQCDALHIDKSASKGDVIKGSISASQDGWFKLCIPYDEGFTVKVDGREQAYECVDKAFIGFEMTKGEHTVEVEFKAPLLGMGKMMSLAGLALFILLAGYDIVKSKKN